MNQFPAPSPSPRRQKFTQGAVIAGGLLLILSGWIALFVYSGQARERQASLENQLAATKAEYEAKERLLHLSDEELVLAAAKAHYSVIAQPRTSEKISGYRIKKLEGDFAAVFTDRATGGGPAIYLKKIDGRWSVFAAGDDIELDEEFRARYGIPETFTVD
jgi:hypothetical protein